MLRTMSALLLLITLQPARPVLEQAPRHPSPKPATTGHGLNEQALDSLIGRSLFSCYVNPVWSDIDDYRPYFDGTNARGEPIRDGALASYFRTNDELKILGGEIVPSPSGSKSTVGLSLLIENQRNKVKAGTVIEVSVSQVTPSKVSSAITRGSNYRFHSIEGLFPSIGMSKSDVLCGLGVPDHTNTDALGGDQMVYLRGKIYVYISARTDRVVDVQTSF